MSEDIYVNFALLLSFATVLTVLNSMFLYSFVQQVLILENKLKQLRAEVEQLRATVTSTNNRK